jgi:hypothetical protein
MLRASPGLDVGADPFERRLSVDLQEAMSVHFDEASSFDLLKDKILFPENDSLDGDLDLDMAGALAKKVREDGDLGEVIVLPTAGADDESDSEMSCVGSLGERLRDMNIVEDGVLQKKDEDGDRDIGISTPPARFSSCNVSSKRFISVSRNLSDNVYCSPTGTRTRTAVPPPKEQ